MAQKRKPGMRLRPSADPRNNTDWILHLMLSLSGTTALILTTAGLAGFRFGSTLLIMLLCGGVFCCVYALLVKLGRQSWFAPGLLVLLLLICMIFRQQILEGWRLYWNQLSDAMTEGKGWILPKLQLQLPSEKQTVAISMLAVLMAGGICLMCCVLSAFAPLLLAVLPPAVLFAGMAWLGTDGAFALLVPVLTASMLVLLCCGWKQGHGALPAGIGWAVCIIAAFFAVQALSTQGVARWAGEVCGDVQHMIHGARYETEHTTLPEGDFREYRIASRKAEPALTVTMEHPEVLYLRGFTGAVFSEDLWSPVDTEDLTKNKDLQYWLNLNAFTPDTQFAAAAASLELEPHAITVENVGACSDYLYVPFNLCDGEYLYRENLNTDGAFGNGERNYTYTVLTGGTDTISQVLNHLNTADAQSVDAYRKAESAYRKIVRTQYLQVPDEVKLLLGEQWNELAGKYGGMANLSQEQAQTCALRFLGSCFPETGIPEELELPLDQARGTPYQYATVAVLTLRYFGIPARYAEGYLITEQMAQKASTGKAITVDSSCAWAWAEVYQEGIGWIPVDLTPGLGEVIEEQPDNTLEGDLETDQNNEENESEENTDAAPQAPETLGGTVVRILKKSLVWLFCLLFLLVLLFVLLWLRRKKLLEKKAQQFRDADVRNAVGWIIADTVLLLEQLGIGRGNGSLRELSGPVNARFGEAYEKAFAQIIALNDRAVFSKRTMDESCREMAISFREDTLLRLKAETKWYRRLWLKWLRCLY